MNKCLNVIGIMLVLLFFPYCGGRETQPSEGKGNNAHAALAEIDSLMWRQPDSALIVLQEFVVSPNVNNLDVYDRHYCQMLISELLYKNEYEQTNREALLDAVAYFDSLTANIHDVSQQKLNVFLDARAHYINGVGFNKQGNVVHACDEYLKALEIMEGRFKDEELIGKKAIFMTYIYNRLMELFSGQFMMNSAIVCGEKALSFCKIEPTSSEGVSSILYQLGKQYDKMHEIDKARHYYEKALDNISSTDNLIFRDIVSSKALCDYKSGIAAESSLDELYRVLIYATTENERLNRYLTIGGIYFSEGIYDSALLYLKPVFENDEIGLQSQATSSAA